ncbi:pentatricopeptide repeat-containing protein At2g13600-like [Selaginella moellendorffii]|uniref:pentatricopeptide repeat-containing protein At2g13600-like n=1 Tax=Selaginella moellendorffii TaxID=88036 RepID=UPI000D1C9D44|nr:pentatricopeptide repeat-containing protein At2g13600-like [Selaginella moellendorffii]|eukprot:XP_024540707.1 pentatricopeptide repeat-containing protein At2g13600-like [Selaginella moellendorffii]
MERDHDSHKRLSNPVLWNSMIVADAQCGDLDGARKFFARMTQRDCVSWATLINSFAQHGCTNLARYAYERMPQHDVIAWTGMLRANSQCGEIDQRDSVPWNVMITAYAQRGHVNEAKCFFDSVEVPNVITWNCMIGAYGQNGHLDDAWALFRRCLQPNIVTWNVLIVLFAQNLHCTESIHLFEVLNLEGFKPDELSFMGLLIACCHLGLVIAARDTLASMVFDYDISPERDHYCCLIGVLAGAGLLDDAEDLINTMPFVPDVSNWGCFVSACKIHSAGVDRSVGAACNAIAMDPKNSAPYVDFATIFTDEWLN